MIKGGIKFTFFAAAAALLLCSAPVSASRPRPGSITVKLADEDRGDDIRDIDFYCIKVASYKDGEYELKEEYKGSGVDLNDIDNALELKEAMEKLAGYRHRDVIRKGADDTGTVKFNDLDPGVYYVKASGGPGPDTIESCLISVPGSCPDGKEMCYDMTVSPKHSRVREEKKASPPKTAADASEGYHYLTQAIAAALFCGIISASAAKKKKVLDNHKPYDTINR